jgi:hypothetical protein
LHAAEDEQHAEDDVASTAVSRTRNASAAPTRPRPVQLNDATRLTNTIGRYARRRHVDGEHQSAHHEREERHHQPLRMTGMARPRNSGTLARAWTG